MHDMRGYLLPFGPGEKGGKGTSIETIGKA